MIRFIKKYKYYLTVCIVILLIIGSIIIRRKLRESNEVIYKKEELVMYEDVIKEEVTQETDSETEEVVNKFFVDIKGAVKKPGVYEIEEGKRVIDVIKIAGGLKDEADTSLINLAKEVKDAMVIIVYTEEEVEKAYEEDEIVSVIVENSCVCPTISNDGCLGNNNSATSSDVDGTNMDSNLIDKININTASLLDLQTLPGIGASKAQAIIDYRDTNGSFEVIEDIKNVIGIGDSLYEKIKDYITV